MFNDEMLRYTKEQPSKIMNHLFEGKGKLIPKQIYVKIRNTIRKNNLDLAYVNIVKNKFHSQARLTFICNQAEEERLNECFKKSGLEFSMGRNVHDYPISTLDKIEYQVIAVRF